MIFLNIINKKHVYEIHYCKAEKGFHVDYTNLRTIILKEPVKFSNTAYLPRIFSDLDKKTLFLANKETSDYIKDILLKHNETKDKTYNYFMYQDFFNWCNINFSQNNEKIKELQRIESLKESKLFPDSNIAQMIQIHNLFYLENKQSYQKHILSF